MSGWTLDQTGLRWQLGYLDRWIGRQTLVDRFYLEPDSPRAHRVVSEDSLNSWEDRQRFYEHASREVYVASFAYRYRVRGFIVPLFDETDAMLRMEPINLTRFSPAELATSPFGVTDAARAGAYGYIASPEGHDRPRLAARMQDGATTRRGVVIWGWLWLVALFALPLTVLRGALDTPRYIEDVRARRRARRLSTCRCGYSRAGLEIGTPCPECGALDPRHVLWKED